MNILLKNGESVIVNEVEDAIEVIRTHLGSEIALFLDRIFIEQNEDKENYKVDADNYRADLEQKEQIIQKINFFIISCIDELQKLHEIIEK